VFFLTEKLPYKVGETDIFTLSLYGIEIQSQFIAKLIKQQDS